VVTDIERKLVEQLISHVELIRDQSSARIAEVGNDVVLHSYNQGRLDAAEAILSFYESVKSGD
jgi:hypothetical protein